MSPVPDKPALEGLESKWSARWEADGVYRFDRTRRAMPSTRSIRLRRRSAARCTWATSFRSRIRTSSPCSSVRGKAVFYPMDGTTTDCRPSDACRTTMASGAIRRSHATRRSRHRPRRRSRRSRSRGPTPRRPVRTPDRRGRAGVRGSVAALGLSVDWGLTYATIGRPAQRVSQLAFLRLLRRDRPINWKRPRCGTSTSARPWRRPSWRIASCRARTIGSSARPDAPEAMSR